MSAEVHLADVFPTVTANLLTLGAIPLFKFKHTDVDDFMESTVKENLDEILHAHAQPNFAGHPYHTLTFIHQTAFRLFGNREEVLKFNITADQVTRSE